MALWITAHDMLPRFPRSLPLLAPITGLTDWVLPQHDPLVQLLKQRGSTPSRPWTRSVDLAGFSPKEVSVKQDKRKLRIVARHEDGEDVTEVKRTIDLPENIDAEKLSQKFSNDGILHLQAPFREQSELKQKRHLQKRHRETSVWDELRELLRGPDLKTATDGQVIETSDGAKRFRAELSVREFKPEEIRVRQQGDCVLVEAEHKQESGGQRVHRRLERMYQLPAGANLDQVVSKMTNDGRLSIEAPFEAQEKPQLKDVPMETEQVTKENGETNGH